MRYALYHLIFLIYRYSKKPLNPACGIVLFRRSSKSEVGSAQRDLSRRSWKCWVVAESEAQRMKSDAPNR